MMREGHCVAVSMVAFRGVSVCLFRDCVPAQIRQLLVYALQSHVDDVMSVGVKFW